MCRCVRQARLLSVPASLLSCWPRLDVATIGPPSWDRAAREVRAARRAAWRRTAAPARAAASAQEVREGRGGQRAAARESVDRRAVAGARVRQDVAAQAATRARAAARVRVDAAAQAATRARAAAAAPGVA